MQKFARGHIQSAHVLRIIVGASLFPRLVGVALLIRRRLLKRELGAEAASDGGA